MQRLPQINFFLITIVLEDAVHSCIEQTLLTDEDFLLSGSLVVPELDIILRGARRRHL